MAFPMMGRLLVLPILKRRRKNQRNYKKQVGSHTEFNLRFCEEEGKTLVILDICKGEETPYYYSGDGVLEAYIRVGNESVKATSTELKRLVLRERIYLMIHSFLLIRRRIFAFSKLKERYKKWTGNSFDEKD